ncbi:uncharacterized protein BDW70DRAFT_131479 [Aspergillus foveolatus]|uniref:uncharacterized protein n=1 Tax=Aspergillus foveolatus TaxID=210207 RepID=UPI003CCD21C3
MYANCNSAHSLDLSRMFDSLEDSELQFEAFAVVQKCRKFADLCSWLESREHQRHNRRESCPPDRQHKHQHSDRSVSCKTPFDALSRSRSISSSGVNQPPFRDRLKDEDLYN